MPPQNLRLPKGLEHWSKLSSCIGLLSVKKNKGSSYGSIYQKQLYLKSWNFILLHLRKSVIFKKLNALWKKFKWKFLALTLASNFSENNHFWNTKKKKRLKKVLPSQAVNITQSNGSSQTVIFMLWHVIVYGCVYDYVYIV